MAHQRGRTSGPAPGPPHTGPPLVCPCGRPYDRPYGAACRQTHGHSHRVCHMARHMVWSSWDASAETRSVGNLVNLLQVPGQETPGGGLSPDCGRVAETDVDLVHGAQQLRRSPRMGTSGESGELTSDPAWGTAAEEQGLLDQPGSKVPRRAWSTWARLRWGGCGAKRSALDSCGALFEGKTVCNGGT